MVFSARRFFTDGRRGATTDLPGRLLARGLQDGSVHPANSGGGIEIPSEQEAPMKIVGMILVVLGIVGLIYGGISWTERDTVVDAGPLEITTEDRESIPIPPIIGALCLAAGVVMGVAG